MIIDTIKAAVCKMKGLQPEQVQAEFTPQGLKIIYQQKEESEEKKREPTTEEKER